MPAYPPPIPNPLVPTVPVEPVRTLRSVLDEVDAAVAGALAAREAVEKALAAVGDVASAAESAKSAASSASAAESAKSAASASASSSASSASSAAESARSAGESASSASASAKSASAVLASADGAASKSLEYAASAAASAELALQRAQSVGDSASVAETRAESAKEYAESARKSAESAEGSVASAAKAGADAAASLLDAKLDRTYADGAYVEEHAAGKVTMSSNGTAAVTLDASDGGSVTVGSSKLTAPSGKLLSNGSEVALADAVRGKADLAVYDVKGFLLDGMKMTVRVSGDTDGDWFEAKEFSDVYDDSFSGGDGYASSCQLGSVPMPSGYSSLNGAVLKVSGVLTGADGTHYVPVGAGVTLSGTTTVGDPYNFDWEPMLTATVDADGSLTTFYASAPFGTIGLYGSIDADPYVEKSTDTLAKSSEKMDAMPTNVNIVVLRTDKKVMTTRFRSILETIEIHIPALTDTSGGFVSLYSRTDSHYSAELSRKRGLTVTGYDDTNDVGVKSTYAVSASVAKDLTVAEDLTVSKDLKVAGDVRVPSLLLYCEDDSKYHRLKAAKMADGSFALALEQDGEE